MLQYIIWNPDPIIFQWGGGLGVRWYSLFFALAFLVGQRILIYMFKKEGKPIRDADTLVIFIILGTILGARLGHVLFYDFDYFLHHPFEVFLPVTFEPTFKFIGYQGMASHGAAIAIILSVYLYANYAIWLKLFPFQFQFKKQKRDGQSFLWVADRIVIVVALAGCFIRLGNFTNSEIIGKPTHSQYGVLFSHDIVQSLEKGSTGIDHVRILKNNTDLKNAYGYQPITLAITFKNFGFQEKDIKNYVEKNLQYLLTSDPYLHDNVYETKECPLRYTISQKKGAYIANIITLGIVRHPAQLYESLSMLFVFLFLFYWWQRQKGKIIAGTLFSFLWYFFNFCIWLTIFL